MATNPSSPSRLRPKAPPLPWELPRSLPAPWTRTSTPLALVWTALRSATPTLVQARSAAGRDGTRRRRCPHQRGCREGRPFRAGPGPSLGPRLGRHPLGALTDLIATRALYADLVVLPKPYAKTNGPEAEAVVEAAMFEGMAPVLVVPEKGLPRPNPAASPRLEPEPRGDGRRPPRPAAAEARRPCDDHRD